MDLLLISTVSAFNEKFKVADCTNTSFYLESSNNYESSANSEKFVHLNRQSYTKYRGKSCGKPKPKPSNELYEVF